MKRIISVFLSVIMLISAISVPASAASYFELYDDGELYTTDSFYDDVAMCRASANKVDLTSGKKITDQVFSKNLSEVSSVNFAGYEFTLKKKDKVTFKFYANEKFISDCVAIYIFNDDHEFFYEGGFERKSRKSPKTFKGSITLSKGTYYLFFATKTNKNVDFDLTISAPKHKETKPTFSVKAKGDGKVKISWKEVPGATKYKVYKYSSGKFKAIKTTTKTSYTIKNLVKNNKYSYVVTAYVNGKWTSTSVDDIKSVTVK